MRFVFRLTLALFAALPLFAQFEAFRVYPPAPTTDTPVTIGIVTTCYYDATYTVEVADRAVTVVVAPKGSCPSPPIPLLIRVPAGKLPGGSYRLRYRFIGGDGQIHDTGQDIHVRHAVNPAPFEVHPSVARTNPAGLQIRVTSAQTVCAAADCSDVTIRVEGAPVTKVRRENANTIWFDAPPHSAGLKNVVIEKSNPVATWIAPDALLYVNGPDLGAFERILFPVLFDAAGANGSKWVAEAVIANPNPFYVENYNSIEPIVCIDFPCRERLEPNAYRRVVGGGYPHGVFLLVPRLEADDLDFALRVRDISRQDEGFGTEVPVVREKDLITDAPIRLLDVPLDPRYRVKLRVYAYDPPVDEQVAVTVTNPETNAIKATQYLRLKSDCNGCLTMPSYAELDLPAGTADERVSLWITATPGTPAWAFATVTNNTTQQVTIVSPQ